MHGSRRAASLQPGDYDHEIAIVDEEEGQSLQAASSEGGELVATDTSTRLLSGHEAETDDGRERPPDGDGGDGRDGGRLSPSASRGQGGVAQTHELDASETTGDLGPPRSGARPSIEIRTPSLETVPERASGRDGRSRPRSREKRETAIDILYENERGGFLCGVALFSGAALGGLDPTPWTNAYHNPSPTDIHTAQVPDPSWEWVWPEWRINEQQGLDEGGWEYSFAFQRQFSWHGPKWWNSFVRRRAWVRKRAKRLPEDVPAGSGMLAGVGHVHIRPASVLGPRPPSSLAGSRVPSMAPSRAPSRTSMAQASSAEPERARPDIEDMEALLQALRSARIDRERREAVENYMEHAIDVTQLQHEMHEIMSLFVFQQSRRQLLSYLMRKHDETAKAWEEDRGLHVERRREALDAAVKHAEEEMCKLAYWSDVKQMAESGELRDAVDSREAPGGDAWLGLDKSAPQPPRSGKMPERHDTL